MFADVKTVADAVAVVVQAINLLVLLLTSIALLAFLITGLRFVLSATNGKVKAERKQALVWSLVALFVLVSISGIIQILMATFFSTESGQSGWTPPPYWSGW